MNDKQKNFEYSPGPAKVGGAQQQQVPPNAAAGGYPYQAYGAPPGYPPPPNAYNAYAYPGAYQPPPPGYPGYAAAPAPMPPYHPQFQAPPYQDNYATGHGAPGATVVDVDHSGSEANANGHWDIPPEKLLTGICEREVRHGFIRKVYALLFLQLSITFGVAAIFGLVSPAGEWLVHNMWVVYTGMAVTFVTGCALGCFPESLARRWPVNVILLTLMALGMSCMIAALAVVVPTEVFAGALVTTLLVVAALTLFAFQTKWDFTGYGPFVMVSGMVLFGFGLVNIFVRNRVVQLIYASIGVLLFSFYLVYDTQKVVGGKHHKFQYSIDDYVFAVLTLYLDIINLFLYILMLFAAADDRR